MTDPQLDTAANALDSAIAVTPAPLGETLLAARKGKNLTQQDVSSELRLSLKQIEALENDDFAALPQAMITRGFIRNYARLLGISAEPLLQSYKARMPEEQAHAIAVNTSLNHAVPSQHRSAANGPAVAAWIKYSLLILLLAAAALLLLNNYSFKGISPVLVPTHEVSPAHETAAQPIAATEVPALPEIALPAAERQPEVTDAVAPADAGTEAVVAGSVPVTASAPAAAAAKLNTAVITGNDAPPAANAKTAALAPVADVNASKPVAPAATKKIQLSASERSWVRVTDKTGKIVFEKILSADAQESVEGQAPFNLVIGNAKATTLTYQGKVVDLAATTENNVAHPVLE